MYFEVQYCKMLRNSKNSYLSKMLVRKYVMEFLLLISWHLLTFSYKEGVTFCKRLYDSLFNSWQDEKMSGLNKEKMSHTSI